MKHLLSLSINFPCLWFITIFTKAIFLSNCIQHTTSCQRSLTAISVLSHHLFLGLSISLFLCRVDTVSLKAFFILHKQINYAYDTHVNPFISRPLVSNQIFHFYVIPVTPGKTTLRRLQTEIQKKSGWADKRESHVTSETLFVRSINKMETSEW